MEKAVNSEIEALLYGEESSILDFKEERYPFDKSSDEQIIERLLDG